MMRGAVGNRKEKGEYMCKKGKNDQQARIGRQTRKRPLAQVRNSRANVRTEQGHRDPTHGTTAARQGVRRTTDTYRNSKETRQLTTGQYKRRTRGRKRKAHKVIQQIKSMYWEVAILQLKR